MRRRIHAEHAEVTSLFLTPQNPHRFSTGIKQKFAEEVARELTTTSSPHSAPA